MTRNTAHPIDAVAKSTRYEKWPAMSRPAIAGPKMTPAFMASRQMP